MEPYGLRDRHFVKTVIGAKYKLGINKDILLEINSFCISYNITANRTMMQSDSAIDTRLSAIKKHGVDSPRIFYISPVRRGF